jgi:hypothetical protein
LFTQNGKTKRRSLPGPTFFLKESCADPKDPGPFYGSFVTTQAIMGGSQITETEGNRWPPPKKGPFLDAGSEFFSEKLEVEPKIFPHSVLYTKKGPFPFDRFGKIEGSLVANAFLNYDQSSSTWGVLQTPVKFNWPPDLSSSRSALVTKGALAVAACSPTNQIANAASAVAELLRDVPSIPGVHLWEARLRAAETLVAGASEFLNGIFGVLPTLGDMEQFLRAVHKIDHRVDQFIRDSGRVVRRRYVFPKEVSVSETVLAHTYSPAGWLLNNNVPPYSGSNALANFGQAFPCYETVRTRTTEREVWFSGAFTYHLPSGYDTHSPADRRRLMAKLFGAEPDLNTLWQFAPWSWAVDWVFDVGSLIKTLQSYLTYGTVLRYGYVMETTTTTDVYTAGKIAGNPYATMAGIYTTRPWPAVSPVTLRRTTKKRIQANPFGFGLSWDGLSTTQKAILAALGITRAR